MSKTVFAFGRMNPPTIGHEKLAAKVESEAKKRGAMPHIYLSHTQNPKKDPLPYNLKIAIARKAFGKSITKSSSKTIIQIMQELEKMGHTEVTLIAGSDRVPDFKTLLTKYNGKEYNFKKIDVVSAGERDPDAEGVEGMSASKLRAIAKEGDYETFSKGMPSKLRDADKKKVYNTIRSVMEDINEAPRIPRKKGQPAGSDKHSDLYTDENPKGTIHGLKFATEKDAEASVAKIKSSGKKHAHKIQAAIAMEQRAKVAGKKAAAAVYRAYINDMKKKTKEMNEEVTAKQISDLEKFGDRLLDKFGVDIEFSKHFADRMNDDRNNPEIKVAEIQGLFKKIARKKAVNIKKHKDSEVVLKDIQKDLNLPVAIKTGKDGELDVVHKTIMRKKNFKTPNPVVQYEETDLDEGVNDPAIFKAVFLAGGPGSGKSFIVGKTGLVNIGMKLVNSDDEFERRLKNAGLDAGNPDDIYSPKGQELRGKAKKTTANKQDMYIKGRLGLVLDGTGKNYDKIKKVRDQLIRLGYDTAMIFVNTNLETSLERNRKRARSLPDAEVEKMWKGVQDNMGKFQKLFGNDFTIVDNSEGTDTPGATTSAYKKMVKFAKQPPKSRAAKNWIANEKSRRGIKEEIDIDPTDKELDDILVELEQDDDLFWEWDEEQLELDLEENRKPLTLQQRMKKRILMRRLAPIIARKRKIKLRRRANRDALKKRARRTALALLKKRFAGNKGKNYKTLSPSEKIGIDKLVQKKLPMVDRIAKRLLPKMLKKETERMRRRTANVNEEFEMLLEKPKVAQDPDVDERPGTQPKKYYSGVSKKDKDARARHFERGSKMDDDNPAAYTPAPGDAKGKTKPSKHTKKFKKMFGEDVNEAFVKIMTGLDEAAEYLEEKQIDALKKKSEKTGIPYGILKQVYNRGMAAWRTGHRPGTTPQQWAFARVNSFATKSKGTWGGADKDLAAKARGSMKKEEVSEADPCWDGFKQVGMKKGAGGKMVPNCVPEEVELDESKYDLYHRDFSSAMQHAYKMAKKNYGITIDPKEIDDKVATGPRKPSEGKTNKYRLKGDKGAIQVQVYNKGGSKPFELNMYKEEVEFSESALIDTKVVKTFPAPKMSGEVIVRKHNKENKFFVRLKYTGKQAKRSRPENLGTFSSLNDAMKAIKKKGISIDEGKVGFVKDKQFPNLRKPKKTTDYEFKKLLMKTKSRQKDYFKDEAVSPAQQAAIAISKKKSGKYDDEGKRIKEEVDLNEGFILQSPRPGIRIVIRKHTDGKRFVFRPMTQGKPGEVKILDKKTAEKQVSALKRMGWKKAVNEEGGAGEEGTFELLRKYKKDTPMQENDAAKAAKERHKDEKESLKRKHDRELDAARLRDTRTKNMSEDSCCDDCNEDEYGWTEETDFVAINEGAAEYQGRKVKLNNPTRSDNPKKKTMVYVKNDKGNVVKVYFGDPNLSIKRDDPERRKSFRARHGCDNPGPKWKARYWSCKFWSSKKVSDLMKG